MKVFHRQIWVKCCDIIFQIINSNQNIVFICEKNKKVMKSVDFFKNLHNVRRRYFGYVIPTPVLQIHSLYLVRIVKSI